MITIFNRKEIISTYSMEIQSNVRNALNGQGIDYLVNTTGGMARNYGSGPIVTSRFGTNPQHNIQYRIYVRRKDYEKAKAVLAGKIK